MLSEYLTANHGQPLDEVGTEVLKDPSYRTDTAVYQRVARRVGRGPIIATTKPMVVW